MARNGVTVYLPRDLELKIRRIAKDQHRSDSSVVAEAVKARYERNQFTNDAIEESARRQISRVDARLSKAIGETLIVKEIVLLFIRVWLEHNPPVEEALEESAAASAEARFDRFLDVVANALAPGQSLVGAETSLTAGDDAPLNGEARR